MVYLSITDFPNYFDILSYSSNRGTVGILIPLFLFLREAIFDNMLVGNCGRCRLVAVFSYPNVSTGRVWLISKSKGVYQSYWSV